MLKKRGDDSKQASDVEQIAAMHSPMLLSSLQCSFLMMHLCFSSCSCVCSVCGAPLAARRIPEQGPVLHQVSGETLLRQASSQPFVSCVCLRVCVRHLAQVVAAAERDYASGAERTGCDVTAPLLQEVEVLNANQSFRCLDEAGRHIDATRTTSPRVFIARPVAPSCSDSDKTEDNTRRKR